MSLVHILFVHKPQVYSIMLQYNCSITCYLHKVGLSCDASAFLDRSCPAALDFEQSYTIYHTVFIHEYGNYRLNTHSMKTNSDINWTELSNIMFARALNIKQKKMPLARLHRRWNPSKKYRQWKAESLFKNLSQSDYFGMITVKVPFFKRSWLFSEHTQYFKMYTCTYTEKRVEYSNTIMGCRLCQNWFAVLFWSRK